MYIKLLVGVFV